MARQTYAFITRHGRFLLVAMCLSVLVLGWLVQGARSSAANRSAGMVHTASDRARIEALLANAGFEPRTLAAVGFHEEGVAALLAEAEAWYEEHETALATENQQLADAHKSVVLIQRSLRRGNTRFDAEDLVAARQALVEAQATATQRMNSLLDAVRTGLGQEQTALLNRMSANCCWVVDTPYRALNLGESEWLSLTNALRCGESAPPEDAAVLNNARSQMDYTLAASNLTSRGAGIEQAWEQAWSGQ